jgi:hypothetical protein
VIFGQHVYQRFTAYLDPNHLRPWWFYLDEIWRELSAGHRALTIGLGVVWLGAHAWRGRPWTARLVFVWLVVPIAIISSLTSKLAYYMYPFLPALALAGGWFAASCIAWAWNLSSSVPDFRWRGRAPWLRRVLLTAAGLTLIVAAWTGAVGPARWRWNGVILLRNTSVLRPLLIAMLLLSVAGALRLAARAAALVALSAMLPVTIYAAMLPALTAGRAPLRAIRDCMRLQLSSHMAVRGGAYSAAGQTAMEHQYHYYLGPTGDWNLDSRHFDEEVLRRVAHPRAQTPVFLRKEDLPGLEARLEERGLVEDRGYSTPGLWLAQTGITLPGDLVLVLPGPYASCTAAAVDAGGTLFTMPDGVQHR